MINTIIETKNYGKLKVLQKLPKNKYKCLFLDTGSLVIALGHHIKAGNVKDYSKPSVYGIGFLGVGKYLASYKGKPTKEYNTWVHMLGRVYGNTDGNSYSDVSVCKEWHNFQTFCEDIPNIQGYLGWKTGHYQLDKDIKGLKEYSPRGCMFIPKGANTSEMNIRTKSNSFEYKVKDPKGKIWSVFSIRRFCVEHSLNAANFHKMLTGKAKTSLGWTLSK